MIRLKDENNESESGVSDDMLVVIMTDKMGVFLCEIICINSRMNESLK